MAIGIMNGTIRDLGSFDQVTGSPRQAAGVTSRSDRDFAFTHASAMSLKRGDEG
jgi:hypothetical protein